MFLKTRNLKRAARRGVALLLTMIFLAIFACLAVAIVTATDANLTIARNRIESGQAAAFAETGVQMIRLGVGGVTVPGTHNAADVHNAIVTQLQSVFTGSHMVNSASISAGAGGVTVPMITVARPDGRTGTISLIILSSGGAQDATTITISSTGRFGGACRTVTYNMTVQRGRSIFSVYGLASKSAITMTGNASITGANNPQEANVLSDTYSTTNAIQLTGNINVAGDVAVCNPDGNIRKTGNIHIGGQQIIGAPEPEWPQVDITPFTPYATNVRSTGASGNITLSNIRIPANSNPTFSGNTTINGVVYVQSPNKVSFTGNVTMVGVIVCDTPAIYNLSNNQVSFTGNVTSQGVESLPAGAQYDGLRSLTGSFLLAPGFSARFTGNSTMVNGCMVASGFTFTGNSGGRVKGGIVNLADSSFTLTGNSPLIIDKNGFPDNPAGLVSSYKVVCIPGSYAE
jgi:filamentous hemagglutinin family protein